MSRLVNRKLNRTPVRSPSPDIANSNIIVRTASPINEAISALRNAKSSKHPLGRSFMNTEDYDLYIKELEEKIRLLKGENDYLKAEGARLAKELDQVKESSLSSRREIYRKSESQLEDRPDLMQEYSSRIAELSNEVNRIHELLIQEKKRNQDLAKDCEELRSKANSPIRSGKSGDLRLKKELADIEYSLNESFERQLAAYEGRIEQELSAKLKRMGKIEKDQATLLQAIEDKRKFASPVSHKSPPEFPTSYRTPTQQPSRYSPLEEAAYSRLRESRELQCEKCKVYLRRIAELQAQINIDSIRRDASKYMKIKASSSKTSITQSQLQEYLQKLQEIKALLNNAQIQQSINHIEQNLNDIYKIDEKFQYMKEEKNRAIQELREREAQQLLEIASLRKEREVLKVEVLEQHEELQKLREMLAESVNTPRKEPQTSPRKKPNNDSQTLRRYIQQAISRIQNLQDQIGSSLRQ